MFWSQYIIHWYDYQIYQSNEVKKKNIVLISMICIRICNLAIVWTKNCFLQVIIPSLLFKCNWCKNPIYIIIHMIFDNVFWYYSHYWSTISRTSYTWCMFDNVLWYCSHYWSSISKHTHHMIYENVLWYFSHYRSSISQYTHVTYMMYDVCDILVIIDPVHLKNIASLLCRGREECHVIFGSGSPQVHIVTFIHHSVQGNRPVVAMYNCPLLHRGNNASGTSWHSAPIAVHLPWNL